MVPFEDKLLKNHFIQGLNEKDTKSRFSILDFAKPRFNNNGTVRAVAKSNDEYSETANEFFKNFNVSEFGASEFETSCDNITSKLKDISVQYQENRTELEYMFKQLDVSAIGRITIPKAFTRETEDGLIINTRTNNVILPKAILPKNRVS